MNILSYHGSGELKSRFTAHVERHRKTDALIRGTYGTEENGQFKGCAVGCSIRSLDEIEGRPLKLQNGNHQDLANRLGIPLVLAHMEDRIFEGLPAREAMIWPTLFAQAIPVGKDLSLVWPRFAQWMLADPTTGVIRFAKAKRSKVAIERVAELYRRRIGGDEPSVKEWQAARSASASASTSSASAASAAADAAYASAASAAADAAAYAFNAAAYASNAASNAAAAYAYANAYAEAGPSHFRRMAEKLLLLMGQA